MIEKKTLYEHKKHPHQVQNVNWLHQAEQEAAGFNTRLAVWITKVTSTMWMAYAFTVLALIGLFGLFGWLNPFTFLLATWVSQQFLQLVFLPILSVGQSVLGRKAELMAEEQFETTQKSFSDIEQIVTHLDLQDAELLKQTHFLEELQKSIIRQNDLILALEQRIAHQQDWR